MAHWAQLDENNIVTQVILGDDNDPNGDKGLKTISNALGGNWIQTSFTGRIRKNFAGIGYIYDERLDGFIPPKFEDGKNYILDETTCLWVESN